MSLIDKMIRKNIRDLSPYSSARDEFKGNEAVFLDANENPFDTAVNRYPDPYQIKIKTRLSQIKKISADKIFLGNGSDEPIDLLIRCFCEPGTDNIVAIKPTYGMYKVCAEVSNVDFREVLLTSNFQIDKQGIINCSDSHSKLLFLCTPNNPTSNNLHRDDILYLLQNFKGLVVLDEAYIDFSNNKSFIEILDNYPNLVVLQTLSKAWGLAGLRLGMAFASTEIIKVLTKVKFPYNVNQLTQNIVLEQLEKEEEKKYWVKTILEQRDFLKKELSNIASVLDIYPSDANFLMVKFSRPKEVYRFLMDRKIIVRDRSGIELCEGCLRITVGTKEQNNELIKAILLY